MARIMYDRKNCEGYFLCNAEDPEDFIAEADGKVDLVNGVEKRPGLWQKDIGDDTLEMAEAAARVCPVDVIKVLANNGDLLAGPEKLPVEEETVEREA